MLPYSGGEPNPLLANSHTTPDPLLGASAPPQIALDVDTVEMSSLMAMQREPYEPSAPPPPTILSNEEFVEMKSKLKQGHSNLPSPAQLHMFRACTSNRLLWAEQMRELAAVADGGSQMFQEAYERQLIADPQNLQASDGPWVQAMWHALPGATDAQALQAAQALLSQVAVTRFDGKTVMISIDLECAIVKQVLEQAAQAFSDACNLSNCQIFAVGAFDATPLGVGVFVKITGLVQNEALNGMIGQIVAQEGDEYDVALPRGRYRVHKDCVVHHAVNVVTRNHAMKLEPQTPLKRLGAAPRFLVLEKTDAPAPSAPSGPLAAIKYQFFSMDVDGDNWISAGEFRSFLWNLHLSDADFFTVKKRFAPQGNYIDLEDVLFLLGRPHVLSPDVPVDALIYEAVVSILGRRTTAHIDKDLSKEDEGIGCSNACRKHCASYTTSLMLQGAVLGLLVVFLLGALDLFHIVRRSEELYLALSALGAYLVYLIHLGCCVRLTFAFANKTEGMEKVMSLMDRPRFEHLHYHWHVQCWHYETRHYQETQKDSNGNTRTVTKTKQERVNTYRADCSGVIPCTDFTPAFVPQTSAQQAQIDTSIDKDFSESNYLSEFYRWCAFHRRDVHQDRNCSEDLPSRVSSCLAVWRVGSSPWWVNGGMYWVANIFLLSFFYRLMLQSRLGQQSYVYVKKCHNINTRCLGYETGLVGAAVATGAILGTAAAAAALIR